MEQVRRGYQDTSIGQVHYLYAGAGEPLLLLHRGAATSEVYVQLMGLLASDFAVVAVDNPGFGMSDHPPRPYTIPEFIQVVLEVLDGLQIDTTNVLGHHTGCALACELAAAAPKRVRRLILSGPPRFDEQEARRRLSMILPLDISDDGTSLTLKWDYRTGVAAAGSNASLEDLCRELSWRLRAEARFMEGPRAVFGYDMASRLPSIEAPTLVVAGEHDWLREAVEPTALLVRNSRQHIIPGGTNRIEIQHAPELARVIRQFLAGE